MNYDTESQLPESARPDLGEGDLGFDSDLLAGKREKRARRVFDQLYNTGRFRRDREELWEELQDCAISLAHGTSVTIRTNSYDTALAVVSPRNPNDGLLKPLIDAYLLAGGAYAEGETGYEWQGGKDTSFRTGGSPRAKLQVFDFFADPGLAVTLEEEFYRRFSYLGKLKALSQKGMRHRLSKHEEKMLEAVSGSDFTQNLGGIFKRYYPGTIPIFMGARSVGEQQWSESGTRFLPFIVGKAPSVLIDYLPYDMEPKLPYYVRVAYTKTGIASTSLT